MDENVKVAENSKLNLLRVVSLLLLLFTAATLWFNWLTIDPSAQGALSSIKSYAGLLGLSSEAEQFDDVLNMLDDGGISVADGSVLLGKLDKLGGQVSNSMISSYLDSDMQKAISSLSTYNFLYQLLFWATILSLIAAAAERVINIKNKIFNILAITYIPLYFIWMVVMYSFCININKMLSVDLFNLTLYSIIALFTSALSFALYRASKRWELGFNVVRI